MQAGFLLGATVAVLLFLIMIVLLLDRLLPMPFARAGLALERMRSGLTLKQATIPGFSVPYLEGGKGEPLVLVHGFAGDKDNFTRVARFLTPHYRVIIPDLPGFGDAGRDPQAQYAMADQAERLRQLLDQIAPGRVHMGGNSMGGFISAQYAAMFPDRVASLWLLDAAGTEAAHRSDMLQRYLASGEVPLLVRTEEDFETLFDAATHKRPFLPSSVLTALGRRAAADFPLHTRIMQQLASSPMLEAQPHYAALPALVVWGEEDQILHPDGAAAFGQLFPRASIVMMKEIGHMPMLEAPRRSAQDYLAFRRALG